MNHTPAPWNWNTMLSASENDKGFRVWANGQWIADVSPINDHQGNSTNGKANARLIAAAPELLAALKSALADLEDSFLPMLIEAGWQPQNELAVLAKARAAIAKAEGA